MVFKPLRSPLFNNNHDNNRELLLPFNHWTSHYEESIYHPENEKKPLFSITTKHLESTQDAPTSHKPLTNEPLKGRTTHYLYLLTEILISLSLLPFIILAITASTLHNTTPSPFGDTILKITQLGPTFYPIIFAAVVGRSLTTIARYKLSHSPSYHTKATTLDSLTTSKTLLSTISTLRHFSLLSVALCLLWSISPLAGQGILHIVERVEDSFSEVINVTHVNTEVDTSTFGVPPFLAPIESDQRFTSALMSNRSSSMDQFGNVRLSGSLLGLPVADIPVASGVTVFDVKSSRMVVEILNVEDVAEEDGEEYKFEECSVDEGMSGFTSHFGFTLLNDPSVEKEVVVSMVIGAKASDLPSQQQQQQQQQPPPLLNYTMRIGMEAYKYTITCDHGNCTTTSSTFLHRNKQLTPLGWMRNGTSNLLKSLSCVGTARDTSRYITTDTYLMLGRPFLNNKPPAGVITPLDDVTASGDDDLIPSSSSLYSSSDWEEGKVGMVDLRKGFVGYDRSNQTTLLKIIPNKTMAKRMEVLLNTYWLSLYREGFGYGHSFPYDRRSWELKSVVEGVWTGRKVVYKVSTTWTVVVCCLTVVPIAVSVLGSLVGSRMMKGREVGGGVRIVVGEFEGGEGGGGVSRGTAGVKKLDDGEGLKGVRRSGCDDRGEENGTYMSENSRNIVDGEEKKADILNGGPGLQRQRTFLDIAVENLV